MEAQVKTLFRGGTLLSGGEGPFYAKGAPIDNPFYPFYDERDRAIILLTPDASALSLLRSSLETALGQVFLGKLSLTDLREWTAVTYDPISEAFEGFDPSKTYGVGSVYLGIAKLKSDMASYKAEIDKAMALAHAATALSLIGCSPVIEKSE